jgi:hypothetical protein
VLKLTDYPTDSVLKLTDYYPTDSVLKLTDYYPTDSVLKLTEVNLVYEMVEGLVM